ncbi:MAG: hypothetical protein ACRCZ9_00225 [Fusobacteriaceae bacterium]
MNYKNDKIFMESVKNDDIFAIKSDLEGLISTLEGNKIKCDEAIEYAIKNSSFNWEEDDGLYFGEGYETTIEKYSYEKGRLVQNFTKERYFKVLDLYKQYKIKKLTKTLPNRIPIKNKSIIQKIKQKGLSFFK